MEEKHIVVNLNINGKVQTIRIERNWTLLYMIREVLNLTGTKNGCGTNDCGACKVLVDGEAKNSCALLVRNLEGRKIVTIEGLLDNGELNIIQQSFVDAGAIQCGFCTPGMIISTTALLGRNPDPSEEMIREALKDNLCRCTGYVKIIDAVKLAALRQREKPNE